MLTIKQVSTAALLSLFLTSCSPHGTPSAPSIAGGVQPVVAVPPPTLNAPVVFTDPLTGRATSDVRDAHDQVVQFTTGNELVWVDGTHIPGHQAAGPGHPLPGNVAAEASCQCWLTVRFGTSDGERRAYLTGDLGHSNPGTVVNLQVTGDGLVVSWSDLFPPGTSTLSGVVTEAATIGLIPIENAEVWRLDEEQGGWDHATTDRNGFYQLHGLSDGSRKAAVFKDGYQTIELSDVPVHGDTRFDVQLLRR